MFFFSWWLTKKNSTRRPCLILFFRMQVDPMGPGPRAQWAQGLGPNGPIGKTAPLELPFTPQSSAEIFSKNIENVNEHVPIKRHKLSLPKPNRSIDLVSWQADAARRRANRHTSWQAGPNRCPNRRPNRRSIAKKNCQLERVWK